MIPAVLSTQHAERVFAEILGDPHFACCQCAAPRPAWVDIPVTLLVMVGEVTAEGAGVALLGPALVGRAPRVEHAPQGRAFLESQGAEGVVRVRRPLFAALSALATVPEYRAQIEIDVDGRRALDPHIGHIKWTDALPNTETA